MRQIQLLLITMLLCVGYAQAQEMTMESLKAKKSEKMGAAGALIAEADALQAQIDKFPGWSTKLVGNLGGNFSGFSDWFISENPNSTTQSFSLDVFGTARFNDDKQFLYNDLILAVGRLSTDNDTDVEDDQITSTVPNKLNLSSLYGYKIFKDIAASGNVTYNTALIGNAFQLDSLGEASLDADGNKLISENGVINNPGDLDVGVGFTWTPSSIPSFYLMVHPLNYHWKFGDNPKFTSTTGAKLKAGYAKEIIKGVSWISTLEGFYAYGGGGLIEGTATALPSADWYEWTNTFAFSVWKGIGVGLTHGIRKANSEFNGNQTRYSVGLAYTL